MRERNSHALLGARTMKPMTSDSSALDVRETIDRDIVSRQLDHDYLMKLQGGVGRSDPSGQLPASSKSPLVPLLPVLPLLALVPLVPLAPLLDEVVPVDPLLDVDVVDPSFGCSGVDSPPQATSMDVSDAPAKTTAEKSGDRRRLRNDISLRSDLGL
jgi:hypothetical protein